MGVGKNFSSAPYFYKNIDNSKTMLYYKIKITGQSFYIYRSEKINND